MASYRWTKHRIFERTGRDHTDIAPVSLWWIARSAGEETLQGSPLTAAWLKLFRTHLSEDDAYWLRWRGDFAESSELRRAYSGLYGRFFARALLTYHLGHSRFISLTRNGYEIPGSARVKRTKKGDIPDWIAWDDAKSRFVLCEAKGSLSAKDFDDSRGPKCVRDGKKQFERVSVSIGSKPVKPLQWVAATKWATDTRKEPPFTILWDPPADDNAFDDDEATLHRTAITRAWLDSIAPGLGWRGADELISPERSREALVVKVEPGSLPESEDWPRNPELDPTAQFVVPPGDFTSSVLGVSVPPNVDDNTIRANVAVARLQSDLESSDAYSGTQLLQRPRGEKMPFQSEFLTAIVTRYGIRPVREQSDVDFLRREQDRARRLEEPAMLVGLPLKLDPSARPSREPWMDDGGIAATGDLAVFDLRRVEFERVDSLASP